MSKNETKHPKVWCDPPSGHRFVGSDGKAFPKIYDRNEHPDFYKWIVEEGYPQSEIDRYGEHFYCRWWNVEEEDERGQSRT